MEYVRGRTYWPDANAPRVWLLTALSICAGCASVTPPEGGARDTKAPVLGLTLPAHHARRVAGRQVTMTFDEPVTTERLTEQLVVTPETGLGTPRVLEKENSLTLLFQRPFAPATTYTVDFGQAIVDVTERNKAANVRLVFSTGDFLDSGRLAGTVRFALAGKPAAAVFVGLYPITTPDSTGPDQQPALYRTKTNAAGEFELLNLKAGQYRLFAFADANNNQRYDEPEPMAYHPAILNAQQIDTTLVLPLARLDTRVPYIASRKERTGALQLQFSEGVRAVRVRLSGPTGSPPASRDLTTRRDPEQPRQLLILGRPREAAQQLVISSQDSAGNVHTDSISTRFTAAVAASGTLVPTLAAVGEETGYRWQVVFPVAVRAIRPVVGSLKVAPIKAAAGVAVPGTTPEPLRPELLEIGRNVVFDSSSSVLVVTLTNDQLLKANGELLLTLDSTALVASTAQAVSGRPLKAPRPPDESTVGTVTVKPKSTAASFALELLKADNTVIRRYEHWASAGAGQAAKQGSAVPAAITWHHLPPGAYRLRALIDSNADGRWTGPERTFTRRPDAVVFSPDELAVRANWEQELTFTF